MFVQEALRRSWAAENGTYLKSESHPDEEDCVTSQVIHDVFGGEILKTPRRKGWHFYNRIDGERVNFTLSENENSSSDDCFDDIPSTPEETKKYFESEDYSAFFMKFVRAFEESVGLEKYRPGLLV